MSVNIHSVGGKIGARTGPTDVLAIIQQVPSIQLGQTQKTTTLVYQSTYNSSQMAVKFTAVVVCGIAPLNSFPVSFPRGERSDDTFRMLQESTGLCNTNKKSKIPDQLQSSLLS